MGVFTVDRPGAALVSRISEMLVSYRWAPTMGPLSYLVQIRDAGSTPCSTTNRENPNPYRLGFFLPKTPVLARFRALAS